MWGATVDLTGDSRTNGISIHAPRVGCDRYTQCRPGDLHHISIHAPRVGCDHCYEDNRCTKHISIHAPRVGCDEVIGQVPERSGHFNPRTPCGVRRSVVIRDGLPQEISIHAPRVGCDSTVTCKTPITARNFNPRTPCGVRHQQSGQPAGNGKFQSTHPVWGATWRGWLREVFQP